MGRHLPCENRCHCPVLPVVPSLVLSPWFSSLQGRPHTATRTSCFNGIRSHPPSPSCGLPPHQGHNPPPLRCSSSDLRSAEGPSQPDPAWCLHLGPLPARSKCLNYPQEMIFIGAASGCSWSVSFGQSPTSKAPRCLLHIPSPQPGHSRTPSDTVDECRANMPESEPGLLEVSALRPKLTSEILAPRLSLRTLSATPTRPSSMLKPASHSTTTS